jgi:hypothetical protein
MKLITLLFFFFLLSGCFFKFAGTDNLYREGKKSNPSFTINRIWCSQCGCEAIELKQIEKGNVVYEMLLNCTDNCPPGVNSYKIEREYAGSKLAGAKYFLLVKTEGHTPLTEKDTAMIGRLRQFKSEPFFQHYCNQILYQFKGLVQTDSIKIVRP